MNEADEIERLLGLVRAREAMAENCKVDDCRQRELRYEIEELRAALQAVEPYLDAIVCYASTMGEHEPNRIAATVRAAIQRKP